MRQVVLHPFPAALFCGLILALYPAACQSSGTPQTPADVNDGSPYGGVSLSATQTPAGPLTGTATICETNSNLDPCVLTGQDNRYRNSTNVYESNLGGATQLSLLSNGFGLASLYQFPDHRSNYPYAPASAQPLYITNVITNVGGSNHCNSSPGCNLLIAATLNDFVYAYDTSQTAGTVTPLWWTNIIQGSMQHQNSHCGQNGATFDNNIGGMPGAQNLAYYGAVATPVIDVNTTLTGGDPILHVVSACVPSQTSANIEWFLDAIDVTNGSIIGTTRIWDPQLIKPNRSGVRRVPVV